jgi:hypothetical protein
MIKSRRMRWAEHEARTGTKKVIDGKVRGKEGKTKPEVGR